MENSHSEMHFFHPNMVGNGQTDPLSVVVAEIFVHEDRYAGQGVAAKVF